MFIPQGRYLTEKLMQALFSTITTIKDIRYLRVFSLFGWVLCLPVWYFVIKRLTAKENLPSLLAFFSVFYLVAMPPMAVSIGWATCLELFIANTAGLLSGYIILNSTAYSQGGNNRFPVGAMLVSIVLGLISLFSYQSGFGCFMIPLLIHFLGKQKSSRPLLISLGVYLFTYIVYLVVFKLCLALNGMEANQRTGLYINIGGKLRFFFSQPLSAAFHFTYIFNENSKLGLLLYRVLLAVLLIYTFFRYRALHVWQKVAYVLGIGAIFLLMYIPPLIVKENYASNRTMLALNMGVFLVMAETLLSLFKSFNSKKMLVYGVSGLFALNAWYNFNYLFLKPVVHEHAKFKAFMQDNYSEKVTSIAFIRPPEDVFVRHFGITRSWDEFGVPISHFSWVPEPYVKQLIFEMTNSRAIAEKITVTNGLRQDGFAPASQENGLLIDAEEVITK